MLLADLLPLLWAHIQLAFPGAIIQEVPGDGDCLFHAIVDQLLRRYGIRTDAETLRRDCVQWLEDNAAMPMADGRTLSEHILAEFNGTRTWAEYLRGMRLVRVQWGDEWVMMAAAALYKATITWVATNQRLVQNIHLPPHFGVAPHRTAKTRWCCAHAQTRVPGEKPADGGGAG